MNGITAGARKTTPSAFPSHSPPGYESAADAQATAAAALNNGHDAAHVPTPNGSVTGRKRKATGAPGSRGVANLTPEQLAKKRANDREAQRAIRERTKNHIESLEARIKELESQQPFQELQRVLAERDAALAEVHELRAKIDTISQVISPQQAQSIYARGVHVAPGGLNGTLSYDFASLVDLDLLTQEPDIELAALTAQQSPLPPLNQQQHQHQHQHHQQQTQYYPLHMQPQQDPQLHPELRSPVSSGLHVQSDSAPAYPPAPGTTHTPPSQYPQPLNGLSKESEQQIAQGERPSGAMGLHYLLEPKEKNSHPEQQRATATPRTGLTSTGASPSSTATSCTPSSYSRLPNNTPPSCPLDSLLNDFIVNSRQRIQAGASVSDVLGPDYPSFAALREPRSPLRQDCHPISTLLIDILSKFPDVSELPEKVAVLYVMFLVMRWSICPCAPCFERLPEWIRPIAEQLEKPHPLWYDNLPWSVSPLSPSEPSNEMDFDAFLDTPSPFGESTFNIAETFADTLLRPFMRKALVNSPSDSVRFEEFFVPYTTTLSLNWPHANDKVLDAAPDGKDVSVNPEFEAHLRDLRNWSLGPTFQARFRDLIGDGIRIEG
jgi:hypothetical protein